MAKIVNDKYYTPNDLARRLIYTTLTVLNRFGVTNISDVIEPSAGSGAFSNQIKCTAYDIEPEGNDIIKADFLKLDIAYKKGRLFIGNPPFGSRNNMSVKFYKKCCELGDYIAFIQPISQLNNNFQMYWFDLIYSEDLGDITYSDRVLHCCFNIYKRPDTGKLNNKPVYKLKDIEIKEYRRGGKYTVPSGYDYAMCNWGNVGKIPSFPGQYAQEVYFYVYNKKYLGRLKELLEYNVISAYTKSIAAKKISVIALYKYLKENIAGIE